MFFGVMNSMFGFSHLFLIYFGCIRTRFWDLFGCVRMHPNAFGGAWTSLDGFGRFCFFPHEPGVGKFRFRDSLDFCASSLPTCSVSAWGWKFACVRKFGSVRKRLDVFGRTRCLGFCYLFSIYFGCVRARWDLFGCVRMHSDAGCILMHSDTFEKS